MLAAMAGFCLTGDIFNLFVFYELMAVSAFGLAAYRTRERLVAARRAQLRDHEQRRRVPVPHRHRAALRAHRRAEPRADRPATGVGAARRRTRRHRGDDDHGRLLGQGGDRAVPLLVGRRRELRRRSRSSSCSGECSTRSRLRRRPGLLDRVRPAAGRHDGPLRALLLTLGVATAVFGGALLALGGAEPGARSLS